MVPTVGPQYPLNHPVSSDVINNVSSVIKKGPVFSSAHKKRNVKKAIIDNRLLSSLEDLFCLQQSKSK